MHCCRRCLRHLLHHRRPFNRGHLCYCRSPHQHLGPPTPTAAALVPVSVTSTTARESCETFVGSRHPPAWTVYSHCTRGVEFMLSSRPRSSAFHTTPIEQGLTRRPPSCHLVSPGGLAGTRPPTYPSRVGGGGGSTQPPSNTVASPTAATTMPHTVTPL